MPALDPSEAAEASARKTWLRHVGDQRAFDRELRRILAEAAKTAEREIAGIITDGVSASLRRAQLQIAVARLTAISNDMWGAQITPAMVRASEKAAQLGVDGLMSIDRLLLKAVGDTDLRESMLRAADNAANNVRSRLLNDIRLSDKVYKTQALANKWVEQAVNNGIALNKSAKEIARSVRHLIDPNVRGGVSYAASRLGRTEINNAFHTTTIRAAADQPWVEGFKWNLSGSHPRRDECNDFADQDSEGLGAGIFSPKSAPGKPHPMCLCYLTVVTVSDEELIDNLVTGKYDKGLQEQGAETFWHPDVVPLDDDTAKLYRKHLGGVAGGDFQGEVGETISSSLGYSTGDFANDPKFARRRLYTTEINDLYAGQSSVDPYQVSELARSKVDLSSLDDGSPIVVVRMGGHRIIMDGHHRALAAAERGEAISVWEWIGQLPEIDVPFQAL